MKRSGDPGPVGGGTTPEGSLTLVQGFPNWGESPPGGDFSKVGGENLKKGERGAILKFWAVIFFFFLAFFLIY